MGINDENIRKEKRAYLQKRFLSKIVLFVLFGLMVICFGQGGL